MPRAGLSRDAVIALAVDVLDENPATPLTLAAVAARAGVAVPSLYKHVPSLDALRDGVAVVAITALIKQLEALDEHLDGAAAVAAIGHAIRRWASEHPGLYAAAQPAPGRDATPEYAEAAGRAVRALMAPLASSGIPGARLVDAVRILRASVHGFLTLEDVGGFRMPEDRDASFDRLLEVVWVGISAWIESPAE